MNVARILALCATSIAGGPAAAFHVGSDEDEKSEAALVPCATTDVPITGRDGGTGLT
jgi:hypothetical protein